MSHMVIFRSAEGKPGYHQAEALDDAVGFVEDLRNAEGVEHARIFRMEEVTFEFRPYFRVELGGADREAAAAEPEAEAPVEDEPTPEMAEVETPDTEMSAFAPPDPMGDAEPVGSGAGARRGLFGR